MSGGRFLCCCAACVIIAFVGGCGIGCGCPNDEGVDIPDLCGDPLAAGGPTCGPLTVMSFNVRLASYDDGNDDWEYRRGIAYEVVRQSGSQVIGLQEACRSQINDIRAEFPEFGEVGVSIQTGSKRGEHTPILYDERRFKVAQEGTFWLSGKPDDVGSNSWLGMCSRLCSWAKLVERKTGKTLWFFNAHFDHVSERVRENSARLIAERIAEKAGSYPVILTGDFNSDEDTRAIKYLKGTLPIWWQWTPLPLADSFRIIHPNHREADTYHGFNGNEWLGKLDYIFVAGDIHVLSATIETYSDNGRYPSDHFPVTATVEYQGLEGF